MTTDEKVAAFRRIDLTSRLGEERLRWLAERAEHRVLEAGETLFAEGDAATELHFFLTGALQGMRTVDGHEEAVFSHREYSFVGAIPLLSQSPYPGTSRASGRTDVLALSAEHFDELLRDEPEVRRDVFSVFGPVMQRWEQARGQREKLAALGSLSAGLAHELNNPASAAGRAAEALSQALAEVQDGVGRLAAHGVGSEALGELASIAARARAIAAASDDIDALDRSDREEELADALRAHGVEDPWDLAADLVATGVDRACAEQVAAAVGEEAAADALSWVAAGARADALGREVAEATSRIAALVRAVKEYTYVDQAPTQDVDVHRGLKTTLTVLGHKLKKGDVRVVWEADKALPPIHAYGSELNQVWTNLIDNAIDAVEGDGTITVRTTCDGTAGIVVQIEDDGPGIPEDAQTRIFEPFFTTKDVGEGTGLGLDVAYRIVVNRHQGDLQVESRPGRTVFTVRLPVTGATG